MIPEGPSDGSDGQTGDVKMASLFFRRDFKGKIMKQILNTM